MLVSYFVGTYYYFYPDKKNSEYYTQIGNYNIVLAK